MIRNENGQLAGYVFVDMVGRDVGGYVQEAKQRVAERLDLPTGYTLAWSGQYENLARVRERLTVVIPLTLALITLLLYLNIAAPMVGGLVTSFGLELLVYPVLYAIWKWRFVMRRGTVVPAASDTA